MNNKLRKLTIALIVIAVVMITTGIIMEIK